MWVGYNQNTLITIAILLFSCISANAQNLVPNNSFENYSTCPYTSDQVPFVAPWSNVGTRASSDYFNACSNTLWCDVPRNVDGYQQAFSGTGYCGLVGYATPSGYREYLTVPLSVTLTAGASYKAGFHVNLSDSSGFAIDRLGLHFSNIKLLGAFQQKALLVIPQIESPSGTFVSDTMNWTLVSGIYIATGGEDYITIGNFYDNSSTNSSRLNYSPSNANASYYYIDEVFVIPALQIIGDSNICVGDSVKLLATTDSEYKWVDSLFPATTLSTDSFLNVRPTVTTTYILYGNIDTVSHTVFVHKIPAVNLGSDTIVCQNKVLTLDVSISQSSYLWQDNSTNPNFNITRPGYYWVEVTNICGTDADTINVMHKRLPYIKLGSDTAICAGSTLKLDAQDSSASYRWQDNSTNSFYNVTQQGGYWVEVSNGCGSLSDTIQISYENPIIFNLGNDTTLCQAERLLLDVTYINGTYIWQNSSTNSTFNVIEQGTFWVKATNSCGNFSDTIQVDYNPLPICSLGNDTVICSGNSLILDVSNNVNTSFLWQDSSRKSTFEARQSGEYWVQATNYCGKTTDTIIIKNQIFPNIDLVNYTELCEGDTLVLEVSNFNANYLWQDNSTNSTFKVTQEGIYWVEVSNSCGSVKDSTIVTLYDSIRLDIGDHITLCYGESILLDVTNPNATYQWQNGSNNATYKAHNQGEYTVIISTICETKSESIRIEMEDCNCYVYLPNSFSPNGDGLNDYFLPKFQCDFSNYELLIFNRWGEQIFKINDPYIGWDGSSNSQGTYVYKLNYESTSGMHKELIGTLTLIQ